MWEELFGKKREDKEYFQVFVKTSSHVQIDPKEIYWAYQNSDNGVWIVIENYPVGFFFDMSEVFIFRSCGHR